MKSQDAARLACIKTMVAHGLNADELEAMTDREVQDRFNVWLNNPGIKRVRLDSAGALTPSELVRSVEQQGVSAEAAKLIAKIIAAHPSEDVKVLKTKSIEYLTTRVSLIKEADREAGRQEEAEAQSLNKKDSTMNAQLDGYGRPIYGSLNLDSATRSDAEASEDAYQRSKVAMNAGRNGDTSQDHTPRGDARSDAAAVRADARSTEDAYQKSKANVNAGRNDSHRAPTKVGGAEVSARWIR